MDEYPNYVEDELPIFAVMADAISKLALTHSKITDETMQNIVRDAAQLCLQEMSPPKQASTLHVFDGGRPQ